MKLIFVMSGLAILMQFECAKAQQNNSGVPVSTLQNRADSVAYAFGLSIGRDLKRTGLDTINTDVLVKAISAAFSGKELTLSEDQQRQLISAAIAEASEKRDADLIQAAASFMETNKAKAGIKTTASGLQYEVIRDAAGDKPVLEDIVTVHYSGKLIDGKVFDSSYDRGEPTTFPLGRVIQGWQEGLQLMPVGAQYRLYVPYELGYGSRGAGQDIPPYSVLVFDVELISIQQGEPVQQNEEVIVADNK